jgi:hypothetical protein
MITFIANGCIEMGLIKKVDCLPAKFTKILVALCQEQERDIVSAEDDRRDIVPLKLNFFEESVTDNIRQHQ